MIYKVSSRGPAVEQIQKALNLIPDGIYGPLTKEAVIQYQKEHNLHPDGIVGEATWQSLFPHKYKKSCRKITELIVHCSATVEGKDYTVDDIRKWHKARGMSDIGYHYVIYRDGTIALGRDVDLIGAHVSGRNSHSIGICYVGGLDKDKNPKDTRTPQQKESLLQLLSDLKKLYPNAKILGHRDCSKDLNKDGKITPNEWIKACPSFDAKQEYVQL